MFPPTFAQIEPSGECNFRCPLCLHASRRDKPSGEDHPAFMSLETFTDLLDQLQGIKELHLQGLGEPFLNPDFFGMVRLASSRGVSVATSSNLSVLDEDLAWECVNSGLSCIHVSIDGSTAATYERMRLGGLFGAVMKNLELLIDVKRRSSRSSPAVRLTTVVTRTNLHEIPRLVELAADYGVEEMFAQGLCHALGDDALSAVYQSLRIRMQEQDYLQESTERIEASFSEAVQLAEKLDVRLRLPRFMRNPEDRQAVCEWPDHGIYITYQGHVTPCCMIPTSDRIMLGDATSQPLEEIWNGEPYQYFRRRLASKHPPEMCCECAIHLGTF